MLENVKLSLSDILGKEYIDKVVEANCFFDPEGRDEYEKAGYDTVTFYPESEIEKNVSLAEKIGETVISPFDNKKQEVILWF